MTPRQLEVLNYIKAHIGTYGTPPNYEQIMRVVGFKSRGNVSVVLHALQEQGAIEISGRKARGIRVVDQTVEPIIQAAVKVAIIWRESGDFENLDGAMDLLMEALQNAGKLPFKSD